MMGWLARAVSALSQRAPDAKLLGRSSWPMPRPTGPALEAASWARGSPRTTGADPSLSNAVVRQRARYGTQNDPWLSNGAAAWVDGLIGAGAVPASTVPDPAARAAIMAAWSKWVPRADADGRTDNYGIQGGAVRELVVAGEALVYLVPGPALRLRLISIDRLESSLTRAGPDGGQVVAGIEFNAAGERVAYHLRRDDYSLATVRVPATDLLHIYRSDQPGQVRGISWFAPVLLTASELSQLLDAQLVAAKTAAMFAGFLQDQNSTGALPFEGNQQGSVLTGGLEPGTIKVLPSGYTISWAQPQSVSTGIELAKLNIRAIAAGLGLPEAVVSGDMSMANYSSMRSALTQWQRRLESHFFHCLVPQLLSPIWRRFLTLEILSNRLDAPGFADDPESWLAVEWYQAPLPWVDPLKDAQAQRELVAAGFASRRSVVAGLGYSVESLDAEIAADREREQALGLDFSTPARPGGNVNG